jgi:hypothetical protein
MQAIETKKEMPVVSGEDIEDLLLSLDTIITEIEELTGENLRIYDEDDEDEEDEEYGAGTLSEEVRKYQREFHRYAEIITRELARLGYDTEHGGDDTKYTDNMKIQDPALSPSAQKKAEPEQQEKNPFERGHKWGCGCAGCSAFRVSFYSSGMSFEDLNLPETVSEGGARTQVTTYTRKRKEDPSDYPCGGRLRGMFSGGFPGVSLNITLEGLDRRPGIMRYLAV